MRTDITNKWKYLKRVSLLKIHSAVLEKKNHYWVEAEYVFHDLCSHQWSSKSSRLFGKFLVLRVSHHSSFSLEDDKMLEL